MKAPSDHLRTIQRRVDFLKSRTHKNSFDLAELGALEWALVNLQAERRPLRDDEIYSVLENLQVMHHRPPTTDSRVIFARAIEAKHGIKENT